MTRASARDLAAMLRNPAVRVAPESAPVPPATAPVSFTVPGRPQPWQRTGQSGKRHYTRRETAAYKAIISTEARSAMAGREPIAGPVRLVTDFAFPVPASYGKAKRAACLAGEIFPTHKLDFDNLAKSLADALSNIVWRDDGQVVTATVSKRWAEAGSLRVVVEEIT